MDLEKFVDQISVIHQLINGKRELTVQHRDGGKYVDVRNVVLVEDDDKKLVVRIL